VVKWSKSDIQALDRTVRRTMTANRCHHPTASMQRIYLPRKDGGRGQISIEHLYVRHLATLLLHLKSTSDRQLRSVVKSTLEPMRDRIQSFLNPVGVSFDVAPSGVCLDGELVVSSSGLATILKTCKSNFL
jgi:hypothetical protein